MMRKEQVISKGKYSHEQPGELMGVKQYLFVKDTDGKKRLLLRFCNFRNEKCSKFAFILYRMDAKGRVIGQERYESADRDYLEKEVFSFHQKIDVEERCTDFKVQIIYAVYGNYTYRAQGSEVAVSYSEKPIRHLGEAVRSKPRKIFHRSFDAPWIFAILSVLILAVGFSVMGLLLMDFKETEDTFTLTGVTYEFVDDKVKGDVIITGCNTTYREVILPSEIEGHKVVGIKDGAFEKNTNIVKLTVDGLNIPANAFEKCTKLETVIINNVDSIGKEAFYGCGKLQSVVINEGSENQILRIGSAAFGKCGKLTNVEINQTIAYGGSVDFLRDSKNVDTLKLRNFAYTMKGVNSAYVTRLNQLFGYSEIDETESRLRVLVVDNMDLIPANFAYGFTKLESVTVNNTNIKIVGENAFRDCENLATFSAKGNLTTIGAYAFAETAIKEISLAHITFLGEYAFKNAEMLSSVSGFGNTGIDIIPVGAFYGCDSLAKFPLHANIKHISAEAFRDSGLRSFVIPEGVTYETGFLRNCQNLLELEIFELKNGDYVGRIFGASDPNSTVKLEEIIPSSLKVITLNTGKSVGDNAFRGCAGATSINLPSEIESVGTNAFSGCKSLVQVDIPSDSAYLEKIENYAFSGCESLKTVPFPATLKYIGRGAFEGCNGLESLSLLYLGPTSGQDGSNETVSYLFDGAVPASLKSIQLLDLTVVDLPASAFYGCKSVEEIIIPSTVTTIGEKAFYNCESLITLKYSDASSGGDGVVDLERITEIGRNAFNGCDFLTSIKLNPNIEFLGESAFAYTGITEFVLPVDAEYVGANLLEGCDYITSFTANRLDTDGNTNLTMGYFFGSYVPSSLTTVTVFELDNGIIHADAFNGCKGTATFNLPEGIVAVGDRAFYECESLKGFDFTGIVSVGEDAFGGCSSLADCDLSEIRILGGGAFSGTAIKDVVLNDIITDLPDYLFDGCESLTRVFMPANLETIGSYVFRGTALVSVDIPSTVGYVGDGAFAKTSLKSLELPTSVAHIGRGVVSECESLESLIFPWVDSLHVMDSYYDYESLSSILFDGDFPQSLRRVELNACNTRRTNIPGYAFQNAYYLDEVILCEGITSVGYLAFGGCRELRYVSLPSTLETASPDAFNGCIHLYEISNPSSCDVEINNLITDTEYTVNRAQQYTTPSGYRFARYNYTWYLIDYPDVENVSPDTSFYCNGELVTEYAVPAYLFYDNDTITSVTLPQGVLGVGESAFYDCDSLVRVEFTGNNPRATYIGDRAFDSCDALTNVRLAGGIRTIGNNAFSYCSNLSSVIFPSALETIGEDAFHGCSVLNNVKLYSSVYSIGDGAFVGCHWLYDVYNTSSLNLVAGEYGFGDIARNAVVIHTDMNEASSVEVLVDGLGRFRKSGSNWLLLEGENVNGRLSLAAFTVQGYGTVNSFRIAEDAFSDCDNITEVYISSAVKQIQAGAFINCSGIKRVTFDSQNSTLNIIERETFKYCGNLRFVTLPNSVTEIQSEAFYGCGMLESIDMPNSLVTIGSSAFNDCSRLVSIVIGPWVESIGSYAFEGCTQLFEVIDLSNELNIRKGSDNHGYVAYYANGVFTSRSDGLLRHNADGAKLIRLYREGEYGADEYIWCLYSYESQGDSLVEISVPYNMYEYGLYILDDAFIEGGVTAIVLPTNIRNIEYGAFGNCYVETVYYKGNSSQWRDVEGRENITSGSYDVRYYLECIHHDTSNISNYWTYDVSGNVSTEMCKYVEKLDEKIEASCYADGKKVFRCTCCQYPRYESIPRNDHVDEDVDGACDLCKGTIVVVGKDFETNELTKDLITVDQFVYNEEKEAFASTNTMPETASSFVITAKTRTTVAFTIEASSRYGHDEVIVNGGNYINYSVSGKNAYDFYIVLDEGETVTISYERSNATTTANDNCGYIKGLTIVEEPTEEIK